MQNKNVFLDRKQLNNNLNELHDLYLELPHMPTSGHEALSICKSNFL